jgi:hypothetical protein
MLYPLSYEGLTCGLAGSEAYRAGSGSRLVGGSGWVPVSTAGGGQRVMAV